MQRCLIIILFFISNFAISQEQFKNPLLPSGADPWSIHKDGVYYYTNSMSDRIVIWRTKNLSQLQQAERKTIFIPPPNTEYSKELWAPEIHFIDGAWYVYFAADNGSNQNHRMYVLENTSSDPFKGEWKLKGKISDPTDKWAIDGSVFKYKNQLYMIWSGWEADTNGRQDIYIAKMKNPWTIEGDRARISKPEFEWETHGDLNDPDNPPHVSVNEGPQFLQHGKDIFIVYSASGCWTENYSLGLLKFTGDNQLVDSSAWWKSPKAVFERSPEDSVFAPGHNSFFKSPDGKEDWILYHANDKPGQGCGRFRSPRAQRFHWDKNNLPVFGKPVKTGVYLKSPSNKK